MEIVRVPVRHHSPACARLVRHLVSEMRPSRVLIEGPSDFEPLAELLLPHRLPIAIYSYVHTEDERSGAYYPFCEYSPEWQAIRSAGDAGIPFEFIDLPWATMSSLDPEGTRRDADGALGRSRLVVALCKELGVESFDDAWDQLFEIDETLAPGVLLERLSRFCGALREADEAANAVRDSDLVREAFMRSRIATAAVGWKEGDGPLLVVTGGYHTPALGLREEAESFPETPDVTRGIALTPYSFERLDAHTGYASGMPSPGFYQAMWEGLEPIPLAVSELRRRKQPISTADLVAAETIARGLAAIRGHARPFRRDVLDGARATFVKDAIEGDSHPVLAALLAAFRGGARGALASGTRRPPLAVEIELSLRSAEVWPEPIARAVSLTLRTQDGRDRSRLLHRVAALGIRGFAQTGGTDFVAREELGDPREEWALHWTPDLEGDCIEAAVYGATLEEAVAARLLERARDADRDAEAAARICVDAALAGLEELARTLVARLTTVLRAEADFARLAGALGHLLYLYRFDDALGAAGNPVYADLLVEAYERGVWLLATLGDGSPPVVEGVGRLLAARRRCPERLVLAPLRETLSTIAFDADRSAALRGAAAGGLFTLGDVRPSEIAELVGAFARPERLGDFLTGLFTIAREAVRDEPALMLRLDEILLAFGDDEFLAALPALRLAFSFFPPREKHHLVRRLLEALGDHAAPLAALAVDAMSAARTIASESSLLASMASYGIRPLPPTEGVANGR